MWARQNASITVIRDVFPGRVIYRCGDVPRPPRSFRLLIYSRARRHSKSKVYTLLATESDRVETKAITNEIRSIDRRTQMPPVEKSPRSMCPRKRQTRLG